MLATGKLSVPVLSRFALAASRFTVYPTNKMLSRHAIQENALFLRQLQTRQFNISSPLCTMPHNTVSGLSSALSARVGEFMTKPNQLLAPTLPLGIAQSRSVVKWSMQKGKRKSVKAVLKRFMRLHWNGRGIWIRPRQRASKRMWKKSRAQRRRCKTHVFCNATQSMLLDKMVTRYWRKRRHYPDDPYEPYMKRESHRLSQGYPREYF